MRTGVSPGHPFYEELERVLREEEFDSFDGVEMLAVLREEARSAEHTVGVYFRMLLIGYFERIGFRAALAGGVRTHCLCASFGLGMEERTPDHSSLSRIRNRLRWKFTNLYLDGC